MCGLPAAGGLKEGLAPWVAPASLADVGLDIGRPIRRIEVSGAYGLDDPANANVIASVGGRQPV